MRIPDPLLLNILAVALGIEFPDMKSKFLEYVKQRFEKNPEELQKALTLSSNSDDIYLEAMFENFVKDLLSDARKEGVTITW